MRAQASAVSALAAAAGLLWSASVSASDGARPPCPPRGQAVIRSDAQLRVYRPKVGPASPSAPVVACLRGTSIRMTLVSAAPRIHHPAPPRSGSLGEIATASPVVAYVVQHLTGVDTSASQLVVADVARRAVLREAPAGSSVDAGFVFSERLTTLAVTAKGEVAWIEERAGIAVRPRTARVMAAGRTGPAVVLDEGPAIEPESLYLSGETVHWVDGAETRGARLP